MFYLKCSSCEDISMSVASVASLGGFPSSRAVLGYIVWLKMGLGLDRWSGFGLVYHELGCFLTISKLLHIRYVFIHH